MVFDSKAMVLTTRPFWSGEAQFAAVRNTHIKPNVSLEPTFAPEWIISKPKGWVAVYVGKAFAIMVLNQMNDLEKH